MNKERYWTFIVYPESLPDNWLEYLQDTGLKIAISPLHDKDINANNEIKKSHYHIVLLFDGPTTYNRVEKITKEINGSIPKRVLSVQGILRYLTHKDNPEKAQYNEEDIKCLNGLDIQEYDGLTKSNIEIIKKDIIQLIRKNDINEYSILINELIDMDAREWLQVASNNTTFFNAYVKSKKYVDLDIRK